MSTDDVWGNEPNDDDFSFDGSGISAGDIDKGGGIRCEGWYHFDILDVVPKLDKQNDGGNDISPCVEFHMSVLVSVDGQSPEGTNHIHRIYVGSSGGGAPSEGSRTMALRFGMGLGVLKEKQVGEEVSIVDAATGETKITMATWKRAIGFQCVAKIGLEKSNNPKYADKYAIPFSRVFRPDDPSVADTVIDKDAWALAKNHSSQQPPPADSKEVTKPSPTPPQAPAVDPVDDLSDL